MKIVLINCLVYNLLCATSLMMLMLKNPRYMMQDYPKEITKDVEGKTSKEKKESLLYGLPFLLILALYPLCFGLYGKFIIHFNFWENWFVIFSLFFSFNLIDLLILDWLVFCFITPKFMIIPGTEGNPGYKNYWFHFIGFLKGCGFLLIGSIIFTSIIELIWLFVK